MKKYFITTHLIFLLLATSVVVNGQSDETKFRVEKVILFTDRTLYVSGEKIQFEAQLVGDVNTLLETSHVLYAELISSNGKSFARGKVSISHEESSGCIGIPEDLITGVYYLRAYTKYMRNFGPDAYGYVPVKVVNPMRDEVLSGSDKGVFINGPDHQASAAFTISVDKKEYGARKNVNGTIQGLIQNTQVSGHSGPRVSIAVVPESSSPDYILPLQTSTSIKSVDYYRETRGISLTGQLKDKSSGETMSGSRINLSIIGEGRDFMATETDSNGRYFFSLPDYTGYRDLFLCVEKDDSIKRQLLVDNDFCSLPVHLPSLEFNVSSDERAAAYKLSLNVRIQNQFDTDTLLCPVAFEKDTRAFYGSPSDVIRLDDYVSLPTLEEYFNEIPGSVNVKKRNGLKYFKVLGTQPEMTYYDPLVLVDYVAISNPDKILTAAPTTIDRIEVIEVPYVKGDITYGGIVSIISKKGDFGGIDLPSSGIFLNYLFLSDSCQCHINQMIPANMPDTRNTLYWNPGIEITSDDLSFEFKTPDTPGKYVIIVKGIDDKGKVVSQKVDFMVKGEE